MPRKATGTIERINDHYVVRLTLPDKSRPRFEMESGATYADAEKERDRLAALAREGHLVRSEVEIPDNETVNQYSERWLRFREESGLKTVDDDRGALRNHILPIIGHLPMTEVAAKDLRAIVSKLDEKVVKDQLAWKTAQNIWSKATSLFVEAVTSKKEDLRVLSTNPCVDVQPPDTGINRSKSYLYPNELLQLLSCEEVSLRWRQVFAIAVYTYTRAGELEALHWEDVDLERDVLHVHRAMDKDGIIRETKTGTTRRLPIEQPLLPLLQFLRSEKTCDLVIPRMPGRRDFGSEALRNAIKTAELFRKELYIDDKTRKRLTFHDLRATGITWLAVRGDDPLKIQRRAGHSDLQTTQGYIREAENIEGAFGEVFPVLPPCLWETSKNRPWHRDDYKQLTGNNKEKLATPTGFEPAEKSRGHPELLKSLTNSEERSQKERIQAQQLPVMDETRTIQELLKQSIDKGDISTAGILLETLKNLQNKK